jgi:hypothetical protein
MLKITPLPMIKTVGDHYKKCKGTKCESCGTNKNLTVHHIFPQEAIKHYNVTEIPKKLLATLCQSCHDEYEMEATMVKSKFMKADPLGKNFDKANGYLARLKSNKKITKHERIQALDYLALYTRQFIGMNNLPESLNVWRPSLYDRYEINEVKKMWKNHYKCWLQRSHMFLNAVYYVET